jgi:hypothetical protein
MNYQKIPTIIEAEQFLGPNLPLPFGADNVVLRCECGPRERCEFCGKFFVMTANGRSIVNEGDYVCRQDIIEDNIKHRDEWVVARNIFDRTYRPHHPVAGAVLTDDLAWAIWQGLRAAGARVGDRHEPADTERCVTIIKLGGRRP